MGLNKKTKKKRKQKNKIKLLLAYKQNIWQAMSISGSEPSPQSRLAFHCCGSRWPLPQALFFSSKQVPCGVTWPSRREVMRLQCNGVVIYWFQRRTSSLRWNVNLTKQKKTKWLAKFAVGTILETHVAWRFILSLQLFTNEIKWKCKTYIYNWKLFILKEAFIYTIYFYLF